MFVLTRFEALPVVEQEVATAFAKQLGRGGLEARTPILSLLGTSGSRAEWNERELSQGHRAIPLVDRALVEGAPMIAALLSSLNVELVSLRGDAAVQLRQLSGGLNARFFVPDARSTLDSKGRHIIASREFVDTHGIRTVFGMGGAYVDGTIVVAVVFTREILSDLYVDRFPSFIGSFKISTSSLVASNALFVAAS